MSKIIIHAKNYYTCFVPAENMNVKKFGFSKTESNIFCHVCVKWIQISLKMHLLNICFAHCYNTTLNPRIIILQS